MSQWAPITPEQWADLQRPRSSSELAKEVWWEEFGRARDAGFDPKEAARIASAEVKLALRHVERAASHGAGARPSHKVPVGGSIVYDPARDRYVRIGDADDTTPEATAYDPARELEHARFARAEKQFAEAVEAETGNSISPEEWAARKMEREELRRQSHVIANKLECGGTVAYRSDEYQMLIWNVFSREAESVPAFRRITFIPHVAAMVRAQKLAALEFFLERHRFCRFWTFTSGERVPLSGLRARVEELHERLNALNKELRRRYGVGLIFRATELGSVETAETAGRAKARRAARAAHKLAVDEAKKAGRPAPEWTRAKENQFTDAAGSIERDERTGELLFHPHAHCVWYSPNGALSKSDWSEMLRFVWEFWGHHWDDGKIIGDAREAVKYCLKPGDVAALAPADLCALEAAIHGLHLVTPLGELKAEIRARKEAGEALRRVRTPEGMVWRVVADVNKQLAQSEETKERIRAMKLADRLDFIDAKQVITNPETGEVVARGRPCAGAPRRKLAGSFCRVVARLAPAASVTPMKEPRVIVMASRGGFDAARVMAHPLTVSLWQQGIEAWEAGRAIRVHTGTPTGETRTLTLLADTEERFAPATEPVWEASTPATVAGRN